MQDNNLGQEPLHWFWVRFFDVILKTFDKRHFVERTNRSKDIGVTIFEEMVKTTFRLHKSTSLLQPLSSSVKKTTLKYDKTNFDILF